MTLTADVSETATTVDDGARSWLRRTVGWFQADRYRIALLGVTLFGAFLRFFDLGGQTLLYDEAATWSRITGSFAELLDILQHDGFAPLHYELYWLLGRILPWTPATLRLIPALAGIAMIPAMYLLARQVTGRNGAILAAIFTCCSAWMLVYSRDAKMYMPLWLCCTLSTASLLAWLRTGRRIVWLCWILCSLLMVALHGLGLLVLGVQVLIMVTHPRLSLRRAGLFLAGVAIVGGSIGAYFAIFNQWGSRVESEGWHESGLIWIANHNAGFTRPYLVLDSFNSYLWAYRRPRIEVTPPRRVAVPILIASTAMGVFLVMGMMPWPRRWQHGDEPPPQPAWLGAIWLCGWIVLPMYAFYCISFGDAAGPHQLLARWLADLSGWWLLLLPAVGALAWAAVRSRRILITCGVLLALAVMAPLTLSAMTQAIERNATAAENLFRFEVLPRLLTVVAIVTIATVALRAVRKPELRTPVRRVLLSTGLIAALCGVIWLATAQVRNHDIWEARYLGVVWPAFAIGLSVLLLRLPAPLLRQVAVGLVIAANLWQFTLRMSDDPTPLEQLASDVAKSQDPQGTIRTILPRRNAKGRLWPMTSEGGIFDLPGKFYLCQNADLHLRPREIRQGDIRDHFQFVHDAHQKTLNALRRNGPNVSTIIYWGDGPAPNEVTPVETRLGPGWRCKDTRGYVVRDFWNWRKTYRCHRIVYERIDPPPLADDTVAAEAPAG